MTTSIQITKNIQAKRVEVCQEPINFAESDVLYVFDVSTWGNKNGFHEKLSYSFGIPSTQKVVFCQYLNERVMHYERTCQGICYCQNDSCRVVINRTKILKNCENCDKPLVRSETRCPLKLHFYIPLDKHNNIRLLLVLGLHNHQLLPSDPNVVNGHIIESESSATLRNVTFHMNNTLPVVNFGTITKSNSNDSTFIPITIINHEESESKKKKTAKVSIVTELTDKHPQPIFKSLSSQIHNHFPNSMPSNGANCDQVVPLSNFDNLITIADLKNDVDSRSSCSSTQSINTFLTTAIQSNQNPRLFSPLTLPTSSPIIFNSQEFENSISRNDLLLQGLPKLPFPRLISPNAPPGVQQDLNREFLTPISEILDISSKTQFRENVTIIPIGNNNKKRKVL